MRFKHVFIPGGAGFIGSAIALMLRREAPGTRVTVLDNLVRRGSELNAARLEAAGARFTRGDVRRPEDLARVGDFDLLVDCAADPSVQSGVAAPAAMLASNLTGSLHCLELARQRGAAFLFFSTSRVYPIEWLNGLAFREGETRFHIEAAPCAGLSGAGVTEDAPLTGARSLYGAAKMACELALVEYGRDYRMPVLINRCGVVAGPWQMAKADQGVVTLWVARHVFGLPLTYIGFGGQGKQVRDVLHIDDLCDLVWRQMSDLTKWDGRARNVGGGPEGSVSLRELTGICQEACGASVPLSSRPETPPQDVRWYVSDNGRAASDFGWKPRRGVREVVADVARWLRDHRAPLTSIFAPEGGHGA
ncbi:MAG TPA: NAD-dependent epimerase/dehydratase family protein [Candidatus Brocadiia bacterium]|nr:NAD-dependent epimerase/dehydratase family protein [Candidatus Brocadiia bacterium]